MNDLFLKAHPIVLQYSYQRGDFLNRFKSIGYIIFCKFSYLLCICSQATVCVFKGKRLLSIRNKPFR